MGPSVHVRDLLVHVREPNGPRTWNEYMKRTKYISQTLLAC